MPARKEVGKMLNEFRHDGTPAHNNSEGRLSLMGFNFLFKEIKLLKPILARPWEPAFLSRVCYNEWALGWLNLPITTIQPKFRWNYENHRHVIECEVLQVTFITRIIIPADKTDHSYPLSPR